ncbi:MAG TPA: hypothetical protein VGR28_00170 [Candidatus Thermoplasmatota archaeon]|nr:hypothetical protein [Candidatus Thermoplasmatota archaeon]
MRGKLQRVERRAKKLHGLQARIRGKIEDLETQKRKGGLDAAKYADKKAKLEAERHALIDELKTVEEHERQLRAELKALEAAA